MKILIFFITKPGISYESKAILNRWAISNIENPYPCNQTKLMLATQSELTIGQIDNWFKLFRHRKLKKTPKISKIFTLKE